MPEPTPKIFISYAWKNQPIAKRLQSDLQRDGVKVFVDYEKISGGDSLPERISAALDWCNTLVLLWSADSAQSYYVSQEWTSAFHLQKRIIACVLDGTPLPALLAGRLYLNFAPYETGYAQLCRSLGVTPKPPAEKTAPPEVTTGKLPPDKKPPKRKTFAETLRRKPKLLDPTPVLKPPEIVDDAKSDATDVAEIATPSRWPRRKILTATLALIIIAAVALTWQIVSREPTTLSEEEVKTLLVKNDFFDSDWNKSGKGVTHHYKLETINGEKIVRDEATGLTWQQAGSTNMMAFADTEKYIDGLNAKNFADHNDWRLPTLKEAMSLMEPSRKNGDLYIDPVFDKTQRWIWTADKSSAGLAWVAGFDFGGCNDSDGANGSHVRAVRVGQ